MNIRSFFPFLEWLPKYKRRDLRGDLQAGLTVGVMLIPQGMAYGLLAGLPPIYGLYAGIVPLLLYAFFGTSRQLSVGPVALVSLLVLAGVGKFAEPGTDLFVQLAITTALIAGIVQILLGLFKLGFLINFLAHPVISGFTSAAAFIIGLSQLKNLFGINLPRSNQIHVVVGQLIGNIDQTNIPTLLIGLGGIAFILILKRINKSLPGALLAVIIGIVVVSYWKLDRLGVEVLGVVPAGLPPFGAPNLTMDQFRDLLPLALTICLISFIESLAIAKTIEAKHKSYRIVPNQELIALGLTKLGGAFFHSYPTTGSFTRSAVNDEAGARTGMSSIFAAIMISLTLLFLTPWFYYLPKALLASVIVVAVLGLINYKEAIHLWKTDRRDFYTLMVTFVATLTLGIQDGVLTGVVLSLAFMIYRNSRPHLAVLGRLPDTDHYRNVSRFSKAILHHEILVVRFDAQLYFGNAGFFQESMKGLIAGEGKEFKVFVLDASNIHDIDSSGIHALEEVLTVLEGRNVRFVVAGAIGPVRDTLQRHGLDERIGLKNFFFTVADAVAAHEAEGSKTNPSEILQDQWKTESSRKSPKAK